MNDLSRGIMRDREVLAVAMTQVLDSGWVVLGPQHDSFQKALARYLGVSHVVGVASGTDALELAIKAAMPEGKNTVLSAANAGGYTSTAARRAGFRVRYADVDCESLCLTEATVTEALTADIGVVVITHLYGNLTDIGGLVALCHKRGIRVVEDCAQAIGARRPEGAAGSFGDLCATSFYPTKNLGALGDGGAVATNNAAFAEKVTQLRQYGWNSKYRVAIAGGANSRLDEIQAAFLLARLPQLDALNERRRWIIAQYAAAAAGGPLRVLPAVGEHHVAHLAVALTPRRDEVREVLAQHGVSTDIHFPVPDHQQPGFNAEPHSLPNTEELAGQLLSLPCFPELTDEEVRTVCKAIGAVA
ncbi:DegT/DnrJ/EryC1/StrS family aminotransferase [Cryobacterium cryoconiti]|uniref:DegT/DnrJ/EryC1/StrS family aminotransferase n=2 Tax=Cryobacterium cryoconiti TaxID=1259239 RepID=A0A4Y8JUU8_9MICO|nr:DegT/DnrJ/EryC1/StrS family aminotransferase [Cryobacterium cryoconiti]